MKRAKDMTESEIYDELIRIDCKRDALIPGAEARSGLPGEWMVERTIELETELERRRIEALDSPGDFDLVSALINAVWRSSRLYTQGTPQELAAARKTVFDTRLALMTRLVHLRAGNADTDKPSEAESLSYNEGGLSIPKLNKASHPEVSRYTREICFLCGGASMSRRDGGGLHCGDCGHTTNGAEPPEPLSPLGSFGSWRRRLATLLFGGI